MATTSIGFDIFARDRASATFDKLGKSVDGSRTKLQKFQRVGDLAGKALAGGLLIAGAAAVKMGQQASDLAETQSKVNQIFGAQGAGALDKFAASAAKSLGQSKQVALEGAATFGVFGKSAGLAGADLVGFSTDMSTLASDMASFNNTSPEDAIEAIGAALRGESEPIRRFGVMLDDATLKAEAMKLGIIKTTTQALTPQQKVLAAQAVIMKQTKDQQGDFARTSEGLANKQRILKAQMANLGAEIGAKVLPAMVKLTSVGLQAVEWVDKHKTLVGVFVGVLAGFTAIVWAVSAATKAWAAIQTIASAATKVWAAGQWLLNAALTANPIGIVVVAVAALVAAIVIAYKKSETFRKIVQAAFNGVRVAAGWLKDKLLAAFNAIKAGLDAFWGKAVAAKDKIVGAFGAIKDKAAAVVEFVKSIPGKLGDLAGRFAGAGRALIGAFVDGMKNAAGIIGGIAGNVWSAVRSMLNGAISKINSALEFKINLPGPDLSINVPDIPHLAKGGIVSRPTVALIGEAGPEAVVPLSRGGGLGGGNVYITIEALDPVSAGRAVEKSLAHLKRLNGGRDLAFQ